ncbi:MAG: PEGA domain-containing protein [Vicinamibacterales bacterium]
MNADARDPSSPSAFVWPSAVAQKRGDEDRAPEANTTLPAGQPPPVDAPDLSSSETAEELSEEWGLAAMPRGERYSVAAAPHRPPATVAEPHRAYSHTMVRGAVAALAGIALVQGAIIVFLLTSATTSSDPVPASLPEIAQSDVSTSESSLPLEIQPAAQIAAAPAPVKAVSPSPAPPVPPPSELYVRTDPPGAHVSVDGKPHGVTPVSVTGLAPGRHRVRLSTPSGSVERAVTIKSAASTNLFVPLASPTRSRAPGWVFVVAPVPVDVFAGGRRIGNTAQGRMPLASGDHQLQIVNETLGLRTTVRATVTPGEVTRVRPSIPEGVVSLDASPTAQVWIDGRYLGETPLAEVRVPLGRREIRFSHPELGEQVRRVMVGARELTRVNVDLRQ